MVLYTILESNLEYEGKYITFFSSAVKLQLHSPSNYINNIFLCQFWDAQILPLHKIYQPNKY